MVTKIHDLKPAAGSRQAKRRVARGIGGRRGKTAGRGMKGQGARDTVPAWFEGGQTPITRRTPKAKGFRNPFRVEYHVVNLDTLAGFDAGSTVDPATLRRRGLVAKRGLVKILGRGDLGGDRVGELAGVADRSDGVLAELRAGRNGERGRECSGSVRVGLANLGAVEEDLDELVRPEGRAAHVHRVAGMRGRGHRERGRRRA